MFAALVAPATATPDLGEGTIEFIRAEQSVDNLSDRKLHLFYHFLAQAKMGST